MSQLDIIPYQPAFRTEVIDLAIDAWSPVFAKTEREMPRYVYESFYPEGWRARQAASVAALLDNEPGTIWLAIKEGNVCGFVGLKLHAEDRMGEVHIIAVAPQYQRQGIGKDLLAFAEGHIRQAGMNMVMVETLGDSGHAPARRTYEAQGYEQLPIARYFKPLSTPA